MHYADERTFEPTALASNDHRELAACVKEGENGGALELCRALRALARVSEDRFATDRVTAHLRLAVAASLLADLCEQDWQVKLRSDNRFSIAPPSWAPGRGQDVDLIKTRIRNSLQLASNRQIATAAVQDFLRNMEKPRIAGGKIVSIATLVDDGEALYSKLRAVVPLGSDDRVRALGRIVRPYLQVCEDGSFCPHTGLPLVDVWRYFRHTWSLEYNPLPGRTMRFLVRNQARPNHPVIGIAMLASPTANMYIRDAWIGWRYEDLVAGLASRKISGQAVAQVLWKTLRTAIAEIRSDDLISRSELTEPTEETLFKLRQIAGLAHHRRRQDLRNVFDGGSSDDGRVVDIRAFGRRRLSSSDWHELSETPLFVRKRAEQLIPLLRAFSLLKRANLDTAPEAALYEIMVSKHGPALVSFVLGELRRRKLATEVADLAVCGAIAPYNSLLGGKLTALLMSSEDVRRLYARRYKNQESEIASQMAGRPIVRSSVLSVVTTTSLYGVSSSQYNRLQASLPNGGLIKWDYLGKTEGITITHVSDRTVHLMRKLGSAEYGARRINSVFGEGSSPRTRQIREGLNLIGINNDSVLMQSVGRRVYACELFPGAREALTGFTGSTKTNRGRSVKAISDAWVARWLSARILNIDVLERVRSSGPAVLARSFRDRLIQGQLEAAPPPGLDLTAGQSAE